MSATSDWMFLLALIPALPLLVLVIACFLWQPRRRDNSG